LAGRIIFTLMCLPAIIDSYLELKKTRKQQMNKIKKDEDIFGKVSVLIEKARKKIGLNMGNKLCNL
jgi:hypothetical protein